MQRRTTVNRLGMNMKKNFLSYVICILACFLAGCGSESKETQILEQLPEDFVFSSGAGGWMTYFNLKPDGSFEGQFHDSDMGDVGEGYTNGTVYICNFDGKFSVPKQVDAHIYSMKLEYLNTEGTPGEEYYEDSTRYIYSEAYGFDDADEFLIYLPGCPLEQTSEDFLTWSSIHTGIRKTLPTGYYGIYNVGGKEGFVGMDEDSIWSKKYHFEQGDFKAELHPSYYDESHLMFFSEQGEALMNLCFSWTDEETMEFGAYDSEGSGEYDISLSFSEDAQSVQVTVTGQTGYDFSKWGGEKEGIWEKKMSND